MRLTDVSFALSKAMKNLILTLVLATAALPLLAGDFPAGSPKFEHSFSQVQANSKKSGKPVVVVFSAVWCGPCQVMKKEVYPSAEVKAFHDKFEWAYIDVDDEKNAEYAKKFGVEGIPHVQFLDKEGNPIGSQIGSTSAGDFAATLKKMLAKSSKS